jgi:uncharacterized protein with HEPN domain
MSRSTFERLRDAKQFAHHGEYAVLGLERDTFRQVVEVKFTVYYCLIGIGEAHKEDVLAGLLASEPTIPWASIVGMRNRLVHAYWRIDDDVVYDVATIELPVLGVALDRIIKRHATERE